MVSIDCWKGKEHIVLLPYVKICEKKQHFDTEMLVLFPRSHQTTRVYSVSKVTD
jgi:hypothetical protein